MAGKRPPPRTTRTPKRGEPEPTPLLDALDDMDTQEPLTFDEIATRGEQEALTPGKRAAKALQEQEALAQAAELTTETVVRNIAELKVGIDTTLDRLAQTLTDQAKKLVAVQSAVAIRTKQLQELYEIEVVADATATLVQQHQLKTKQLQEEATSFRAAAHKEEQSWRESFAAEKEAAKKSWQREQEEYRYDLKTKRGREEEEYAVRRQSLLSQLSEEKSTQDKLLGERERSIAEREGELAALHARVAAFDAELQKAVLKATEEATRQANAAARHAAELREKDAEATQRLLQQQIQSLEQRLADQATRTEQIQSELRESTSKVREIAVKAIEGASGAAALTRVSEIAMTQAKGRGELA